MREERQWSHAGKSGAPQHVLRSELKMQACPRLAMEYVLTGCMVLHLRNVGMVVPLVVRLRGIVNGEGEQSQTTYAVLHASSEAALGKERVAPRCVRQKVLCQGRIYESQEVYGATQGAEDDPCVVCQTEPRECIILPCRHCCLCFECAKDLTQTGSVQVEFGQVVTGADPKYGRAHPIAAPNRKAHTITACLLRSSTAVWVCCR